MPADELRSTGIPRIEMQEFGIITLFPEIFDIVARHGITGRAFHKQLCAMQRWNPRDYTNDRQQRVDDASYGGGPGMVIKYDPLAAALSVAKQALGDDAPVLLMSATGRRLDQALVAELAAQSRLILIAGRYEGIDQRFIDDRVDAEISIGDFVVSGGEAAAAVLIDAIVRLLPGALGNENSAQEDSFATEILDHPHFTRPEHIDGCAVPEVLLSGDHAAIGRWRRQQALGATWLRRPDLLASIPLSVEDRQLLEEYATQSPVGRPSLTN